MLATGLTGREQVKDIDGGLTGWEQVKDIDGGVNTKLCGTRCGCPNEHQFRRC